MYDLNIRIKQMQDVCISKELDAVLIGDPNNNRYLAQDDNCVEGIYLIYKNGAVFFTDFRYYTEIQNKNPRIEIIEYKERDKEIAHWLKNRGINRIGFESSRTNYLDYENWSKNFIGCTLVPCKNLVENLRLIKDDIEIDSIKNSIKILKCILEAIPALIADNSDITEKELALEIEYKMRKSGAEGIAFNTIVASGKRSAFPHATPTTNHIQDGKILLIDAGAVWNGYNSDQTRTLVVGKSGLNKLYQEIFKIVKEAQEAAFSVIKPGISSRTIDTAARSIIENYGYGSFFGHGTGHGVGIEVHEAPIISKKAKETILKEGMVFTVEPGIYIPDKFGIRWEDMILVTKTGYEILTLNSWNYLWMG